MGYSSINQARVDMIRNAEDEMIQDEARGARQIREQTNCTWTEALVAARRILGNA